MVHQYLKTCVLSVCVAVSCGDRAFGVEFWCQCCYEEIKDENWGKHVHESQNHGTAFDKPVIRCTPCGKAIGDWNAIKSHREECHAKDESCLKYNFHCPTCYEEIHADDWFVHLWYEHGIPNSVLLYRQNRENSNLNATFSCWEFWKNLKTEGSLDCNDGFMKDGSFLCQLCQPGKKSRSCRVPVLLWYDHLKEKHRDHLPERNFFCKTCNDIIDGSGWNEHVKEKHANWLLENGWKLYCKECKMMVPKENWNNHVLEEYKKGFFESKDGVFLWCETKRVMILGKDWNSHVEAEMEKSSSNGCCKLLCRICRTMVSKDDLNKHVMDNHRCAFFPDGHFLTEPDLWCAICGKVVLMVDWNKHTVSEHKGDLQEGYVKFWCRICNRMVPPKDWNAHVEGILGTKEVREKHNMWFAGGFWDLFCSKCNVMVSEENWNEHMEAEHKGFDFVKMFRCSQCKQYFLAQQSRENHVKNKHQDWFFCDLCDDVFCKNKKEHFEEDHPGKGFVCACGAYFRKDCDDGKTKYEHLLKHSVKCELCNKEVTIDHMESKHGCNLNVCRPEKITGDKVWEWRHDPSCKSMLSCPLCGIKSILPDVEKHIREDHKCTQECRFNVQEALEHDASCMNGLTRCHLCGQELVRAKLKNHGIQKHGCAEECPMLTGKGNYHRFDCKKYVWKSCFVCGCENPPPEHLKISHGCQECIMVQKGETVYVEHRDHEGKTGREIVVLGGED